MHRFLRLVPLLLLFAGWNTSAKDVRDTLFTRMGDRIIVPYEYALSGGRLIINFRPPVKFLSSKNEAKYKKRDDLTLVFFDRNGNFQDASFQGDLAPEAFVVPANAVYSASTDGYYLLHESPTLAFQFRNVAEGLQVDIPLYLAFHQKKSRYKLITRCDNLRIKVDALVAHPSSSSGNFVTDRITTMVEVEPDNEDMTKVLDCIANIRSRLPSEDRLPFSENLEGDIRLLREWQYSVTDNNLKKKVFQTLDDYGAKKRELEDAALAAQRAEQDRMREEQRREQQEIEARNEAAAVAQREEAEKNKKRNLWMIIGGGLLAIGAFVGNQFLQRLRTEKSQKDMMQMQQSMVSKAQNAAKQKIQGAMRQASDKSANKVKPLIKQKPAPQQNKKKKYTI